MPLLLAFKFCEGTESVFCSEFSGKTFPCKPSKILDFFFLWWKIDKYHLTLVKMAISKNLQTLSAGEGVENRVLFYYICRNINRYSYYEE